MTEPITFSVQTTHFGYCVVARSPAGIRELAIGDHKDELIGGLNARWPGAIPEEEGHPLVRGALRAVRRWPASRAAVEALPIDPHGTEFQRDVWDALRTIPSGETINYMELAAMLDKPPTAARAVGAACAANPIAMLIPCHRVLRADGSISGFRWGVQRKASMLAREGIVIPEQMKLL